MKIRMPDKVFLCLENDEKVFENIDTTLNFDGGYIQFAIDRGLNIKLKSETYGVKFINLRWNHPMREDVKVLGDAWERGYGDFEWKAVDRDRNMPWYMAISNGSDSSADYTGRFTECFGVGVLPNAFALWKCDEEGVMLSLELRCGAGAVYLEDRELDCATVYFEEYREMSAFNAVREFCRVMSPAPLLADHVVYGSNNWYYAYGNSSHEEIISDSLFVKNMCDGAATVPYMVIDDGWQKNACDAPWDICNERFPDMKRLADEMKQIGVRPGIWVRYLRNGIHDGERSMPEIPERWYLKRKPDDQSESLDPSHPEVLDYVKETTKRLTGWGYKLIKHDFSTFDIFGRWGVHMREFPADGEWRFYDKNKTSAEIIKNLYKTIKEAAGDTIIIGCNVIGHLCAGIHEFNRTGDDTSGYDWSRTRKMGVNTLAFRLVQNNIFFGADADCVGITGAIDWKYNKQWLKLLAFSGSCLFVSCKPGILNEEETTDLKEGFMAGARQADTLIPLDWMESATPQRYLLNGEEFSVELF